MFKSRRSILKNVVATAGALATGRWMSAAAQTPQPMPSPNAPTNQNFPGGLNGPPVSNTDKSKPNPLNQEHIAALVEQVYKLASELKDQVEHTNLTTMFPLDFVKKAQQIEKLAKQIKDQAKG
ncbi:MAG TPA: hypothetical protein VHW70_00010 [Edaphobacter sp.]|jgi:hypothetical protein|nr:hypothetical protein [Edaphobacter sp.]